jgi:hypothetical protein
MLSSSPTVPLATTQHEANLVIEEAGDVVFRLNLMGQILFASQRAANLLRNGQDMEGQPFLAFICDLDHAALKSASRPPNRKSGLNCA